MRSFFRKVVVEEVEKSQQQERYQAIDFVLSTSLFQDRLKEVGRAFEESRLKDAQKHLESAFQLVVAFLKEF